MSKKRTPFRVWDKLLHSECLQPMTPGEYIVLHYLVHNMDNEMPAAEASITDIARQTPIARSTVKRNLNSLEKKGYIKRFPQQGCQSVYVFTEGMLQLIGER